MTHPHDPSRHAIYEASAGTGKTHAVGQIVLRVLTERLCDLENLLIVTFTEKATGELKVRLRREIERAIDVNPSLAETLQPQLDQFDQAAISTIHGFCSRVLRDHAADLGQELTQEFADDKTLRLAALREVQRKDWPAQFGDGLADLLKRVGYSRDSANTWDKQALEIVGRYRPGCGHRLLPETIDVAADPSSALLAFTVTRIVERLRDTKERRGLVSFDDLIERTAAGLDPACNPRAGAVAAALREQYRFAIVDEFQDTDPLQWSIFRRAFLEAGESKLIVVGDPKQSIYGFRGADLPTYLTAVRAMSDQFGAAEHSLAVNWRSTPEMIESLNRFFEVGGFFPPERGLSYVPVAAPEESLRRFEIVADESGRPALTIVDATGDEGAGAADVKRSYADFLAREVLRLLAGHKGGAAIRLKDKNGERSLSASDIGVLVFTKSEGRTVAAALGRAGVPYSTYKASGVRASPEARDIRLILDALAHPDEPRRFSRALLTMFFRAPVADLIAASGRPTGYAGRALFDRWLALAEARRWSELFQSLLDDTGVLFVDRDSPEYDRRVANLKLLVGQLLDAGYRDNLGLFELRDLLVDVQADAEESDDYQPLETEDPRVKIMTIHSAKGLEFPIVFLAGGFTDPRRNLTYRDENERLVFDLPYIRLSTKPPKDPRTIRNDEQKADEQRRLIYVALTRAQGKLYVPTRIGGRGVARSAIGSLIRPALEKSGILETATIRPGDNQFRRGEVRPKLSSVAKVVVPIAPRESLLPTFDAGIGFRRSVVQSFTGLHRLHKKEQATAFGERPDRADEVHETAADPAAAEASDQFRGPVFGELVHQIFEHADFTAVKAARSEADLDGGVIGALLDVQVGRFLPKMTTRGPVELLGAECRRVVRKMVWAGLRTPLTPLGGSLCELTPADRIEELEFLYPQPTEPSGLTPFVTGFMDLVFRWRGSVYLLDWKTNVLPSYDLAGLEAGMTASGYHLQYRLYWDALSRWLSPGPLRLAGVFYMFVRGMNGIDDRSGVYFVPGSAVRTLR